MEKKKKSSAADGISELPDDILHYILSLIKPRKKAAQTITLSRRWRSLWRSYPIVSYFTNRRLELANFQKFCEATIRRFSQDSSLRIQTLKLRLIEDDFRLCFPVYKQLLDLSSERKAQEIDVWSFTSLPFQLLSNSSTKIIRITSVRFAYNNDLALSLNSLRFLYLYCVSFEDDRILGNVLASSPLLEILKLDVLCATRVLKVSTHHTNLKTLRIARCSSEKVEIAVPGLQTLRLEHLDALSKFELTAPQLNLLKIIDCRECCFDAVISKLQSLKTLRLSGVKVGKKLKLSNPKLEEFMLRGRRGLEDIEIDAGPRFVKFLLKCDANDEIKKCQISNVRLDEEVDFSLEIRAPHKVTHQWFVALQSLLVRLTNFSTVNIIADHYFYFEAEDKEDDHSMPPVDIKHLTIQIAEFSSTLHSDLLGRLFRVLRPRYLTIMQGGCDNYEMLVLNFVELMKTDRHGELFQEKEYDMYHNWQGQLKDIKIATSVVDRDTKKIVEAVEFLRASKRMVTKLRTVSFMLTWLVVP